MPDQRPLPVAGTPRQQQHSQHRATAAHRAVVPIVAVSVDCTVSVNKNILYHVDIAPSYSVAAEPTGRERQGTSRQSL